MQTIYVISGVCVINAMKKGKQVKRGSLECGGWARRLFMWVDRAGCSTDVTFKKILNEVSMMTVPLFVLPELISVEIQSHIQLPPDLCPGMSQDTSHSPCPIPSLESPCPRQHTLILPHLPSRSVAPLSQMLFTTHL